MRISDVAAHCFFFLFVALSYLYYPFVSYYLFVQSRLLCFWGMFFLYVGPKKYCKPLGGELSWTKKKLRAKNIVYGKKKLKNQK